MGHGSYKSSDWEKLKKSRGITATSSVSEIFKNNGFNEKYNPKFISVRESRDSEDSPNSTPVILAFDVTGSMGYLAEEIAKNSLNRTITEIYDKQPITNPHVMCAAITEPDPQGGLQVTQFEADIRVVEQLLELRVGFGGNRFSYDSLIWYFAANHTDIDCYNKRGQKGFLFTIGDEVCGAKHGERLSVNEIKSVFDDDVKEDIPLKDLYHRASEKYEVFHIIVGSRRGITSWNEFIPGRVAYLEDVSLISELVTAIMQITNGADKKSVLNQWQDGTRSVLEMALSTIDPYPSGILDFIKKIFK